MGAHLGPQCPGTVSKWALVPKLFAPRLSGRHTGGMRPAHLLSLLAIFVTPAGTGCSMFTGIWEGDMVISSADDIATAEGITDITGNLIIEGTSLQTLAGLEGIRVVDGDVVIGGDTGNTVLASLDGLSGITTIGGFLAVRRNPLLPNLSGLSALERTGDSFTVAENSLMTTMGPLPKLTTVGYFMSIENNRSLVDVNGLDALVEVDFTLNIASNAVLASLEGFSSLRVAGRLFVRNNIALSTCAAESLRDQLLAVNGMTRYDGLVDIAGNLDTGPCP
jgi:hypothetical protein